MAFSPAGQHVASGSRDIRVWDIKTGQIIAGPFQGHSDWVNSVAYSPDGKYITSCSDDTTIRMWDIETGETIAGPFPAHSERVNSVAYSQDGKYLVSGSRDGTTRVWNVEQALARANLRCVMAVHTSKLALTSPAAGATLALPMIAASTRAGSQRRRETSSFGFLRGTARGYCGQAILR